MAETAPANPLRRLRAAMTGAAYERKLGGVRTSDHVMLEELGLEDPDRFEYRPSPWRELRKVLPPSQVGPDDVFIDLGCGMGRAVLLAARYPMKRVIGVELSEDLTRIAQENVDNAREHLAAGDVEVVQADVLEYELPDDVTIVYLYNPFTGEIFARALEQILASLDRRPRPMRIIYRHALEHEQIMATGRARQVSRYEPRSLLRRRAGSATNVYELQPRT
jgi:SAM-dependent methyltransferase